MFHAPEKHRIRTGRFRSGPRDGNNGAFWIRSLKLERPLLVIASDGLGWEHVSVSLPERTPTWEEMAFVKALFWDPEDAVMELHPPRSQYINNHPHCLHLWRPIGVEIPLPPAETVGLHGTIVRAA
jgi:hypothetical protein